MSTIDVVIPVFHLKLHGIEHYLHTKAATNYHNSPVLLNFLDALQYSVMHLGLYISY
ncbi:MAG: hypothetical protein WDO15_06555 [Bacteroidota bacterium]